MTPDPGNTDRGNEIPCYNGISFQDSSNTPAPMSVLRSLTVHGSMVGAVIRVTTPSGMGLGRLVVGGTIQSSAIIAAANIGAIAAQALQLSVVYAGLADLPQGQSLPSSSADLSQAATISEVAVTIRLKSR